jgi:hypothetical protein
MRLVDFSPVRYAFYAGDVNQDYAVDGSDLAMIDNDAYIFVSGYLASDLNGDYFVDASDYALADNNAGSFIVREAPPGAPSMLNNQGSKPDSASDFMTEEERQKLISSGFSNVPASDPLPVKSLTRKEFHNLKRTQYQTQSGRNK